MEKAQTTTEQTKPHELPSRRFDQVGPLAFLSARWPHRAGLPYDSTRGGRVAGKGSLASDRGHLGEFCRAYIGLPEQVVHCLCQAASSLDTEEGSDMQVYRRRVTPLLT